MPISGKQQWQSKREQFRHVDKRGTSQGAMENRGSRVDQEPDGEVCQCAKTQTLVVTGGLDINQPFDALVYVAEVIYAGVA